MIENKDFSSMNINYLTAYLKANQWIISSNIQDQYNVWHRPEEQFYDFEIVQPLNNSILGFNQRIFEVINTLAQFESRNIVSILNDINQFNYDLLKVRVIGSELDEGAINLNDGIVLFEKVKNLILSVIHSTASKKAFYTNISSIPLALENYYQSLKFGQTEHGSYIVNVLAPHQDVSINPNNSLDQDLTTTISENFDHSLAALNKALQLYSEKHSVIFFQESISNGVSANLCESIIGMSGKNEKYDIEITIHSKKLNSESKHIFKSKHIEHLKIATEHLKGHQIINNYCVNGTIIALNKQPNENTGSVTIKFKLDNKSKNIKLELEDIDYLKAVKAHGGKCTVSINGDLIIDGKKTILLNFGKLKINDQESFLFE